MNARELLAQHDGLRALTIDLVQAARTVMSDGPAPLAQAARLLGEALMAHNRREEELLEPLLYSNDLWSSMRVAEMLEDHRVEHEAFVADLGRVAQASHASVDLEARVFELAAAIYRHMELEEIEYLNARVMRDDVAR